MTVWAVNISTSLTLDATFYGHISLLSILGCHLLVSEELEGVNKALLATRDHVHEVRPKTGWCHEQRSLQGSGCWADEVGYTNASWQCKLFLSDTEEHKHTQSENLSSLALDPWELRLKSENITPLLQITLCRYFARVLFRSQIQPDEQHNKNDSWL